MRKALALTFPMLVCLGEEEGVAKEILEYTLVQSCLVDLSVFSGVHFLQNFRIGDLDVDCEPVVHGDRMLSIVKRLKGLRLSQLVEMPIM